MTKEVALRFDTHVDIDMQKTVNFLEESRKVVRSLFEQNPKLAIQALNQVSAIEAMSHKIKLDELQQQAMISKVSMQREIGTLLMPLVKRGPKLNNSKNPSLKDLGISEDESKVWQKYATLPEYAWNFALKQQLFPRKTYLLTEIKRFVEIRDYLDMMEDVRVDQLALKEYFVKGYVLADVKADLEQNDIQTKSERKAKSSVGKQAWKYEQESQEEEEVVDDSIVENMVDLLVANSEAFEHIVDESVAFFEQIKSAKITKSDRENIEISMDRLIECSKQMFKAYRRARKVLKWQ
jgi:hypothetical protein